MSARRQFDTHLYVHTPVCPGARLRVRIADDGVHISESLALPRCEIVGAVVLPITGSEFLRVFVVQRNQRGVTPWTFDVANRSDADEMLRQLRAGLDQQTLHLRLDSEAFGEAAFFCGIAFTVGGLLGAWLAAQGPFAAIFAGCVFGAIFSSCVFVVGLFLLGSYIGAERVILVGRDGIVLRTIFGHRFYAYADIARLERRNGKVELVLYGGRVVSLFMLSDKPVFPRRVNPMGADALTTLLHLRIEEAMAAHQALNHDVQPRLRGMPRVHSYREHAAPDVSLREVVVDSQRSETVRLAAAFALLEDEGAREVGELAQSVASPRLRVALEKMAEGADERDVVRALEKHR